MGHGTEEITPFLKTRRAALDAAALGLPDGPARRRVRGLRREEVAQLAGISVDYYTRIEQGRAPSVSDSVVDAVARALRMTPDEHAYLRNITLPRRHTGTGCCDDTARRPEVRPQIRELLDALDDTVPAVVHGPGMDVLAWNRIASRIAFDYDTLPERDLNTARLVFLHPDARKLYPDWPAMAAEVVAILRAEVGHHPDDVQVHTVLCDLTEASPDFSALWDTQSVLESEHGVKRIYNPLVGELTLTYESFALPGDPGQRLCTYTAPKGSPTEERLHALADLAAADA
ncbi:helix-turn-helix transcriptional regulator [Sphaerisporangium rubeum]|uniref:Transcriptional regulator with XRE-family HTH domain n=1 Tax=Sphaerisporangium rubeum TaxID=321317 RepID=A0A7X0M7N3_9ACTN|nr:helix-turn-helix transcriptional regulator [Sphaerisporangium rubeum]MBB6474978.1 transcriptional regulator with XRE-family HTH domain [Sphaerisporangium rubeum]